VALALAVTLAWLAPASDAKKRVSHSGQYLKLAKKGLSDARRYWWDSQHNWFDDRLNDTDQNPLGTVWTMFGVWEAYSGVATAQPTPSHKSDVEWFSNFAESYFNHALGGYGPYPGSYASTDTLWYDDNAWWGLGFMDAYQVTHDQRYVNDAAAALNFMDSSGWNKSTHTFGWNNKQSNAGSNLETLGGAAALAAELYEATGTGRYRQMAHRYIRWGQARANWTYKKHKKKRHHHWHGIYRAKDEGPLSYIEGTFLGADLALCRSGQDTACMSAWQLASKTWTHYHGRDPFYKPPADTILFRYVLRTVGEPKVQQAASQNPGGGISLPKLWRWARKAGEDALNNARNKQGLFVKFWDGSKASSHHDGYRSYSYGQLLTHGAPVALLAWLGAIKEPQ